MSCGSKRCEDLGCFGMCDSAISPGKYCIVCKYGSCQAVFKTCPRDHSDVMHAPPQNYHTISPGVYVKFEVPNRLAGVQINSEGDAV